MTSIDRTTPCNILEQQAEKDNPEALFYIAYHSACGTNGFAKDDAKKIEFYQKGAALADQGSPAAQFCRGICYSSGFGVVKDARNATRWFLKAAKNGFAEAQFALGFRFHVGDGITQDLEESLRYFHQAAEQGHEDARRVLDKTIAQIRKSAEHGDDVAQRLLNQIETGKLYQPRKKDTSDKSLGASIANNIEGFIRRYPNYPPTDYLSVYCHDYVIDCYEWCCPDGCDRGAEFCERRYPPSPYSQVSRMPSHKGCPRMEKRVYTRTNIGELTEGEVKFIADIALPATFVALRRTTDISLDTPEERLDHCTLLQKFEEFKAADRQELSRQKHHQITVVAALVKLATNLRKTRQRAWGYSLIVGNIPGIPIEQTGTPIEQSTHATHSTASDNLPAPHAFALVLAEETPIRKENCR
jgi:hypothetical protein